MPSLVSVLFGADAGERLRLDLSLPADGEGWIRTRIEVRNGSFYGSFETSFRDDELVAFRSELRAVYENLTGEACLRALDGCLSLDVAAAGRGAIDVSGSATDDPGTRRQLRFGFVIDQSFLPQALDALDKLADPSPAARPVG